MCQLVEVIKIFDKKFHDVNLHNENINRSRRGLFGLNDKLDFREFVTLDGLTPEVTYKLRFIYGDDNNHHEIIPYRKKKISKIVFSDIGDTYYEYKYINRPEIKKNARNDCAEIETIFLKEEQITDSTFSNLVFKKGVDYFTPKLCLYNGIRRRKLLKDEVIKEKSIFISDLNKYDGIYFINSMLELGELVYKIEIPI